MRRLPDLFASSRTDRCGSSGPRPRREPLIAELYGRLIEMLPTPVSPSTARLRWRWHGLMAGLALVDKLDQDGSLANYYLLPATRGDLLRRLDHKEPAKVAYHRALELASTNAERRFLATLLAEMSASSTSDST